MKKFIEELSNYMSVADIECSPTIKEQYKKNVTEYHRDISGIIFPENEEALSHVIRLANKHSLTVHPIAQGKNWGFGSRLPSSSGAFLLDFSRHMNRILHVDADLGYAVIEPGVTQEQLANYLREKKFNYYVDVTGSSKNSSIVGNIVERGIGFNRKRSDLVLSLRVLVGNGDFINTSHCDTFEHELKPTGCQPDTTQLFIQSNFGIVTRAFVRLLPIQSSMKVFNIVLRKNIDHKKFFEDIRLLYQQGILECIVHLYDCKRLGEFSIPFIGTPQWFGVGNVKGDTDIVSIFEKKIKKNLKKHGWLFFYKPEFVKKIQKLSPFKKNFLELLHSSVALQQGSPQNAPVLSAFNTLQPDLKSKTLLNFAVFAFAYREVNRFIETFQGLRESIKDFDIGVSLNMIDELYVEAVICVSGPREKIHKPYIQSFMKDLIHQLCDEGFHPFRIDIEQIKHLKRDRNYTLIKTIKKALDSKNIISPGRY